jgi:hypothetical protein
MRGRVVHGPKDTSLMALTSTLHLDPLKCGQYLVYNCEVWWDFALEPEG